MSSKQAKAIDLIKSFSPKDFGVKNVYYKVDKEREGELEVLFIVKESDASRLISYLNSLSSIVEKKLRNIKINSRIHIYSSDKNEGMKEIIDKKKLKKMDLITSECVSVNS